MMVRILAAWLILSVPLVAQADQNLMSRYINAVFTGDLSWMLDVEPANDQEARFVDKFHERFVERREVPEFATIDDELVRAVAGHFQTYWTDALLDPAASQAHEMRLRKQVSALLTEAGYDLTPESGPHALIQAIRDRGWGFQGGRTPPLQDFILWRETEVQDYAVELSDGVQPVTVHFLDDFVSEGWANFATFGHTGTGGWANDDGLFCISSAYDRESERFLVSYLKHEARHYADYQLFPKLEGADLEYRAKLTELMFVGDGQGQLIEKFIESANGHSDAPHPLANYHVLTDVAGIVRLNGSPQESSSWQSVDPDAVRAAAGELFERHNQRLYDEGSDTATGILTTLR